MTFNSNRKAALAVTAGLVGALTLGGAAVAPVAAYADGASTLTVAPSTQFGSAKVYGSLNTALGYTGDRAQIAVAQMTIDGSTPINVTGNDFEQDFVEADAKGKPTDTVTDASLPGTYFVRVKAVGGTYAGGVAYVKFTVSGASVDFSTATWAFSHTSNSTTVNEFTYDAENVTVASLTATIDSKSVTLIEGRDYKVEYAAQGSTKFSADAPANVGKYTARVTGLGAYAGNESATEDFEISKLDIDALVKADVAPVVVAGDEELPSVPTLVKGSAKLAAFFEYKYSNSDREDAANGVTKTYMPVLTLTEAAYNSGNFIGRPDTSATFEVYKAKNAVEFTYDGKPLTDLEFVLADGHFDVSKLKAVYTDANGKTKTKTMTTGQLRGNFAAAGNTAGTYTLSVADLFSVDASGNFVSGVDFGGSQTFTVTNYTDALDGDASIYLSYKGTPVTSVEKTYDGKDAQRDIAVAVKDANGNDISDFTVTYTDADGKPVSTLFDAGEYTAKVSVPGYKLTNDTFKVTVKKLQVKQVAIAKLGDTVINSTGAAFEVKPGNFSDQTPLTGVDGAYQLAYTGSDLNPLFVYTDGSKDADGDLRWFELDGAVAEGVADIQVTKDGKTVNKVIDRGAYTLTVKANEAVNAKNAEFSAEPYTFTVAKAAAVFSDVKPGAWYYDGVNTAYKNWYVNGLGGTKAFGPERTITRADAVGILYNMAGGDLTHSDADFSYKADGGYETGFSDVDGNEYFARALAWAKKAGVANGNEGKFNPYADLTREEFAAFLSNYAKFMGRYEAVSEDALSSLSDGASVSAWAKDACNWAVSNKVMGKGGSLSASQKITRAEVACMAVSWQPTPVKGVPSNRM